MARKSYMIVDCSNGNVQGTNSEELAIYASRLEGYVVLTKWGDQLIEGDVCSISEFTLPEEEY